jgi:hypothetical protein
VRLALSVAYAAWAAAVAVAGSTGALDGRVLVWDRVGLRRRRRRRRLLRRMMWVEGLSGGRFVGVDAVTMVDGSDETIPCQRKKRLVWAESDRGWDFGAMGTWSGREDGECLWRISGEQMIEMAIGSDETELLAEHKACRFLIAGPSRKVARP